MFVILAEKQIYFNLFSRKVEKSIVILFKKLYNKTSVK